MKNSSPGRAEIFPAVVDILSDRLAIPKKEIHIDSCLINDLGIDSLDFLDVIFCLERRFAIKIRDSDFNKLLRGETPAAGVGADDPLTPRDIENLAVYVPNLKTRGFETPITIPEVWSYVTVESLVIVVEQRLSS